MFGCSKEKFSVFVQRIDDDLAFVELTDKDGGLSFMEIPKKDFEKFKIIFEEGIVFLFTLRYLWGWEKVTMSPPKKSKPVTEKEFKKFLRKYTDEYGDV